MTDTVSTIPDGFTLTELKMGYASLIGPLYRKVDDDGEWFGLRIEQRHCNRRAMAHGGVLTSLADIVMGRLAVLRDSQQRGCLSVNLYLDFMDTAPLGCWLKASARIERQGRRIVFTSSELHADGKVVAQARSTLKYFNAPGTAQARPSE